MFLVVGLLAVSCSKKGVHMSKHRKSRKCNCPTFSQMQMDATLKEAVNYDAGGTV